MNVGVDRTLDERWAAGEPECGEAEDVCASCGDCLGCFGFLTCATGSPLDAAQDRHVWLNSKEEVKTL